VSSCQRWPAPCVPADPESDNRLTVAHYGERRADLAAFGEVLLEPLSNRLEARYPPNRLRDAKARAGRCLIETHPAVARTPKRKVGRAGRTCRNLGTARCCKGVGDASFSRSCGRLRTRVRFPPPPSVWSSAASPAATQDSPASRARRGPPRPSPGEPSSVPARRSGSSPQAELR
jgi:hypothetical protein